MKILKAISNNTKLRLMSLLINNELCVCEFEDILEVRQVNISKNLISLKDAGIVGVRREKQRGFYYLTESFLENKLLVEHISLLKNKEEILKIDYELFLAHEEIKDQNIYVCNTYKKEVM
ncbi:MAG: metalloregulator ArsR/SmtB family transcription factor [Candidatus Izemoplasma sp.]